MNWPDTIEVLIFEDEKNLGLTLSEYLTAQGINNSWYHSYTHFKDTGENLGLTKKLALIDINLPDINGLDLAQYLKKRFPSMIFLFMSAQNEPELKLKGFELGGSDYITKPFSLKELMFRINRVIQLETFNPDTPQVVSLGKLKIDFAEYTIVDSYGHKHRMAHKESSILKLLYGNLNKAVSREQIIDQVWGMNRFPSNRTIDNYIVKFRKWLETDPSKSYSIVSIRGIGYKLQENKDIYE